ncbi:hypothetical protein NKG05_09745 [Oerskovia sp. M15]
MTPTPSDELFERLAGVRDFGAGPGLVVQQTANAWAGAVSRQGFVKFPGCRSRTRGSSISREARPSSTRAPRRR